MSLGNWTMSDSGCSQQVQHSGAGPLSRLFRAVDSQESNWRAEDLGSMLRHQLDAPLGYDLRLAHSSTHDSHRLERQLALAQTKGLQTFRDLFLTETPPVELLRGVKDFFKQRCGAHPERRPEQQVAYVLYVLSLLCAEHRCRCRITRLSSAELAKAAAWAAAQPWIEPQLREVLFPPSANAC